MSRATLDVARLEALATGLCLRPAPAAREHDRGQRCSAPSLNAPTIFHEPWWLDITTEGRWAATQHRVDGRVVASLPYWLSRKGPFTKSGMPPFTHFLGPAIDPAAVTSQHPLLAQLKIVTSLIEGLPPVSCFRQKFHRDFDCHLAFAMQGYSISVQYTFEVAPASSDDRWRNLHQKTRNVIRVAQKQLHLDLDLSASAFTRFYAENLAARSREATSDLGVAQRLIEAARQRGQGEIFAARDAAGALQAAIFYVWDARSSYYLMSSRRTGSGNGAVPFLVWNAIAAASAAGRIFDFEGAGHQSSVRFYSGFGGVCRPRFTASRTTRLFDILACLKRNMERHRNSFTDTN